MFKPISLNDQEWISAKIKEINTNISEYSFGNLYAFRNTHNYELDRYPFSFIKGSTLNGESFLMPLFSLKDISSDHLQDYLSKVNFLYPIEEESLKDIDSEIFKWNFNRDDSEYLFSLFKMRFYPGRHLDGRRFLVNQLLRNHKVTFNSLDSKNKYEAVSILDAWQQKSDLPNNKTDYYPCLEAIQLMEQLGFFGYIAYVDGTAHGFVIAEVLAKDTLSITFAKATTSIPGIYPYLFQQLAKSISDNIEWVNLEQDLGLPTLRMAKMAYLPDKMLNKFRVMIR